MAAWALVLISEARQSRMSSMLAKSISRAITTGIAPGSAVSVRSTRTARTCGKDSHTGSSRVEHGSAPDVDVARWQDRLTPLWKPVAGGCHLNRPIKALIRRAGFGIADLPAGYMAGPKPFTFMYEEHASKSCFDRHTFPSRRDGSGEYRSGAPEVFGSGLINRQPRSNRAKHCDGRQSRCGPGSGQHNKRKATMSGSTQTSSIGFKTAVREADGIFASQQDLQAAIDDLLTSGFARCELSLRGAETDATAGHAPEALADDPATPRTDHFCTEALGDAEGSLIGSFAVLPALGVAWAGAAAGAGFLAIGALTVVRRRRHRGRGRTCRHAGPASRRQPDWPGHQGRAADVVAHALAGA